VVKVLDFGLVRALDEAKQSRQSGGLADTPLYMSPEAIQTPDLVDARSDIYAVGAIGYFLITGHPVFSATTLVDLCQQHVTAMPVTPSERLGRHVSPELEAALLACLEKTRAKRPQTARDLATLLDRAPTAGGWTLDDAEAWWGRHERAQATSGGTTSSAPPSAPPSPDAPTVRTSSSGFDQTLASGRSST
jgi:serine/threonine protein kinase